MRLISTSNSAVFGQGYFSYASVSVQKSKLEYKFKFSQVQTFELPVCVNRQGWS